MIYIAYFMFLFVVLFAKFSVGRFLILNPLTGFIDAFSNVEMLTQSFLNFIVFIPIGYFFTKNSRTKTLLIAIIISVSIETLQYIFALGFCDTFDMILYSAGMLIGRTLFKKFKLSFMEEEEIQIVKRTEKM